MHVHKRRKDRHGEHIFCQLPNSTIRSLPAWMLSAERTQYSLGPPQIGMELRDLQLPSGCDKASPKPSLRERVDEDAERSHPTYSRIRSLLNVQATAIPDEKQRDLALAPVELLINATRENVEQQDKGDRR